MKKSVMSGVTAILMFSLAGCAQGVTRQANYDPEMTCGDRVVTVFQAIGFLAVYPEYIDVCGGQQITVNLVPREAGRALRTAPEEGNPGEDGWLTGVSRGDHARVITVPPGTQTGVYKYSVTVNGVGTLDPRARVVR